MKHLKRFNESNDGKVFRIGYFSFVHNGKPSEEWFAEYAKKVADHYGLEFSRYRIKSGSEKRYNTSHGEYRKGYYLEYDFDEVPTTNDIDEVVKDINVHFYTGIVEV